LQKTFPVNNLSPERKSNNREKITMKTFYNRIYNQLFYISHPAGGFLSLADLKKRKKKKLADLQNNPSPESYNVRGITRDVDPGKLGAP
jgi:uncharacterized protein RhaS with RHS repeats